MQTLNYFQKKIKLIFCPWKLKKNGPQKLLIIGPNLLFHSPAQPTAHNPELIFQIIKFREQASVLLSVQWGYLGTLTIFQSGGWCRLHPPYMRISSFLERSAVPA